MFKITLKDGTIYNFKNIKINKYTVDGKNENDIISMIDIRNIKEISFEVNASLGNKIEKAIISINGEYINDFIFNSNNRTSSIQTQNVQDKVIFSLTIPNDEEKERECD